MQDKEYTLFLGIIIIVGRIVANNAALLKSSCWIQILVYQKLIMQCLGKARSRKPHVGQLCSLLLLLVQSQ